MKWQWHFTWPQDMKGIGYLPSFTCVSNRSPSTYAFHVPHKKKPAARIKCLIAISLSKYTSVACCNLVVGRHRVLASCGCPAREGQAGLCPQLPDVIHPTHCTCVTLGSCHTELWTHRGWGWCLWSVGLSDTALNMAHTKGKTVKISTFQMMKDISPRSQFTSQVTWTACCLFVDYIGSVMWLEIPG